MMVMYDERKGEIRRRLITHLDHFFRPPALFYEQIETVIGLAQAGRHDEEADLEGRRYPVKELVEHYNLDYLIEWLEADDLLDEAEWNPKREAEKAERARVYEELGISDPFW